MTRKTAPMQQIPEQPFDVRCRKFLMYIARSVIAFDSETEVPSAAVQRSRSINQVQVFPTGVFTSTTQMRKHDLLGPIFAELQDGFLTGLATLIDVVETGEHFGCCGPVMGFEPNLRCKHGHAIGEESGDCTDPHFVWLDPNPVVLTLPEHNICAPCSDGHQGEISEA